MQLSRGFLGLIVISSLNLAIAGSNRSQVTNHNGNSSGLRPLFESPEHASIGDNLILNFPKSRVSGAKFAYNVHGSLLSFGDIIALAADYFYHWKFGPCAPSISDDWDSNPSRSRIIASDNVNLLRTDWEGFLDRVLREIHKQRDEVEREVSKGRDVAQVYAVLADSYDQRFALHMKGGYIAIALCNPDHFGKDAHRAYSSVHDVALSLAKNASSTHDLKMLREAYFTDAYAQHYLTDMFAAGHIRPPRRVLHSDSLEVPTWMPGDRCAQKQHDEDGANGLWVTNLEGQSWSAYGDKQFGQGRSAKNRQMVSLACQISVDEIWQTFQNGKKPEPKDFKALRTVPLSELTFGPTNFVPLFQISPEDNSILLFRANIDARQYSNSRRKLSIKLSSQQFLTLQKEIEVSGAALNKYVYTKAFRSEQKILHLGAFDVNDEKRKTVGVVANLYGQVNAGNQGQNWGMTAQGMLEMPKPTKKLWWNSVEKVGDSGIFSLVGTQAEGDGHYIALHVGLSVKQTVSGQATVSTVWSAQVPSSSRREGTTAVIYGNFDKSARHRTMVKYYSGDHNDSKLEFWNLPPDLRGPPVKHSFELPTSKLSYLVSHKIANDTYSTTVAAAGGALSARPTEWYFISFENGIPTTSKIVEPNQRRPQALVSHPNGNLVRIAYGSTFPIPKTLQIEILTIMRSGNNTLTISSSSAKRYGINWHGLIEQDYLLWFLHDVNGDGLLDLVAYCTDASKDFIDVVVFPGLSDKTYGNPTISPISLPSTIGRLFTAEFMTPLYTTQASYTYPAGGEKRTEGAIMSFFDNYGIIGTRIVAPEGKGSYKYVLAGQDGAIAGQRSLSIGERPAKWMGSASKAQPIGIVAF